MDRHRTSATKEVNGETCKGGVAGNPCNPATGNKFLIETDYVDAHFGRLAIRRFYNSLGKAPLGKGSALGPRWTFHFDRRVVDRSFTTIRSVLVYRPNGRAIGFTWVAGRWTSMSDETGAFAEIPGGGWRYVDPGTYETEIYSANGRLQSIIDRTGRALTMSYSGDQLASIADSFGRRIDLAYDDQGRLTSLTDPAGRTITYGYSGSDAQDMLSTVRFQDGSTRTYHYNEPEHTSGADLPQALTGTTDENDVRFATYTYHADQRVRSTEHAGAAQKTSFAYNDAGQSTQVTNAFGTVNDYYYASEQGTKVLRAIGGPPCPSCGPLTQTWSSFGFLEATSDWNRIFTSYERKDPSGRQDLETKRIEAANTPEQRTISTEWHPTLRLVKRLAEPKRLTTFFYNGLDGELCGTNAQGVPIPELVCRRQVQATSDASGAQGFGAAVVGATRTWRYSYNSMGQVTVVNRPREDLNDRVYFSYDAQGNLTSVRNALGHRTTLADYDAHGRPGRIVDPNGQVTTLTYTPRGWLAARTTGGRTTRYDYDGVGQLVRITLPDGAWLAYTYDDAHRLTEIRDALGNRIVYTLDALGNRIREAAYDPAGTLKRTQARVYDSLNRLIQDVGGTNPTTQITQYSADNQGNRLSSDGPLPGAQDERRYAYDALGRLIRVTDQVTDPLGRTIRMTYDGLDQVTALIDPRGLTTTYTVDGLGNVTQESSPDRGITTLQHNSADNVRRRTDARGQTTSYVYDAVNRLISQRFADGSAVSYTYDQGANAIGRLSAIAFPGGETVYGYSAHGERTSKEDRHAGGPAFTVRYGYDATTGRLNSMTYPSGKTVTLAHDAAGRVNALAVGATPIAQAIGYLPFGRPNQWRWGNGLLMSEPYDRDGRPTSIRLRIGHSRNIGYDAAGRLIRYSHPSNTSVQQDFAYDALDRLIGWTTPNASRSYAYDANGNRASLSIGADTYAYTTPATSNRLAATAGPLPIRSFSYDQAGNITTDGRINWTYNARGRMASAIIGTATTTYTYDGLGQRVKKSGPAGITYFVYDEQAQLLGEYDAQGNVIQEYVYLAGELLAILKGLTEQPEVFYVYTDPVGRAWTVTDTSNRFRWRWDPPSFGESPPDENPSGVGAFVLNWRGSWGYYDRESGLHNNIHRDYDPGTGRFVQVDPLGLADGTNPYAYANLNPLLYIDPLGLFNVWKGIAAVGNGVLAAGNAAQGAATAVTGTLAIGTGVGAVATVGAYGVAAWKFTAAYNAAQRAKQLWKEAKQECSSDGSIKNLLGILPLGTNFDDPHESLKGYVQDMLNSPTPSAIIDMLQQGVYSLP